MCEKHRILRILYHIPSKCGIPIFKFFQKTGHSRSSKRNTQYARPCKRRERAKQNMASRGKGAASSRGTAMRRPRSGAAGQHIGKPAQAAAEVWTSQQFRSQRFPVLPAPLLKGAVLPGGWVPTGLSTVWKTGGGFAGSHSPVPERRYGDSLSPPPPTRTTAPPAPGQETEKAVYNASGVTVSSPTACSSRKTGYLSMSRHLPAKKSPVHQFMHRLYFNGAGKQAKRRQWRIKRACFEEGSQPADTQDPLVGLGRRCIPSWVISALRAALRRLRSETRLRA